MPEQNFTKGIFPKRNAKAPGFVICSLSIKCEDFYQFLTDNVNDAGYVNIDVLRSKNKPDELYSVLNTWKPEPSKQKQPGNQQGGCSDEPNF